MREERLRGAPPCPSSCPLQVQLSTECSVPIWAEGLAVKVKGRRERTTAQKDALLTSTFSALAQRQAASTRKAKSKEEETSCMIDIAAEYKVYNRTVSNIRRHAQPTSLL